MLLNFFFNVIGNNRKSYIPKGIIPPNRWSEAECEREGLSVTSANQRQELGRALSLIRFPLMTVEEFAQGPAQSGILTDREVVQLFLHFTASLRYLKFSFSCTLFLFLLPCTIESSLKIILSSIDI